jgi:hypothetical protein
VGVGKEENMGKLRSFMYMDEVLLNDYIGVIEGGSYSEEWFEKSEKIDLESDVSNGHPLTGGEGSIGNTTNTTVRKNKKISDSTKFNDIYEYLDKENSLAYFEQMDQSKWDKLRRDDFVEVLVDIRFSKLSSTLDAVKKIAELGKAIENMTEQKIIDKKAETVINSVNSISSIKEEDSVACVMSFAGQKDFQIVTHLNRKYMKYQQSDYVGQFYALCKVQSKIEKGKSIYLDELLEDIKRLPLNREQTRKMKKNDLSNPKEISDQIKGPAIITLPIAIYR